MFNAVYDMLRSAAGFCLVVVGIGFLFTPKKQRATTAFGILNISVGALFLFSWFSIYYFLPAPLDLTILVILNYALGLAVFEINVYLFGDEKQHGRRRLILRIGAVWSLLIWLLPFVDVVFGFEQVYINIEDARPFSLFQSIANISIYIWPLAMAIVSIHIARFKLNDLPSDSRSVRALVIGLAASVFILMAIGLGLLIDSQVLYRWGHVVLELSLVYWYLYVRSHPDIFPKARTDIGHAHKKRVEIGAEEAMAIGEKLTHIVAAKIATADPDLDLPLLAKISNIPSSRLSAYFNMHKGLSFSAWLNAARIEHACMLLREKPDLSILEVAYEVGYSSKSAFNGQFLRQMGITPSVYKVKK
ncbi:hypothetical protein MASR2M78_20370 [Treponema sp.]